MTEVRLALPNDDAELLELLKMRNAEDRGDPLDIERVLAVIMDGILRRGGLIGVIRGPARIEATIGLFVDREWYSAIPRVKSRWDFVHPDHRRKTTHARDLITFGKHAAAQLGCPLEVSLYENVDTAEKIKMVGRQMPLAAKTFLVPRAAAEPAAA